MLDNEMVNKRLKIIFLWTSKSRFTERDLDRFGVSYFRRKGYICEIWSIHTNETPEYEYTSKMYSGEMLYELGRKQYKVWAKKNRDSLFIIFTILTVKDLNVLARNKCKYILYGSLGAVRWVYPQGETSFIRKWSKVYKEKRSFKTLVFGVHELYCKMKNQVDRILTPKSFPPLFVVEATKEANQVYPVYMDGCKKIYIHSLDYDRYVEVERMKVESNRKYILWIDSGWGFIGGQSVIKSTLAKDNLDMYNRREIYFRQLKGLFEKMERHFDMPVIIAGHPHTIYDKDMYDNREFHFGRTAELVKNAEFVMMSISTSLSLTLLWDKEILLVGDSHFRTTITWREWGEPTCEMLGIRPFDWDNKAMKDEPWKYVAKVNSVRRKAYLDAYVDSNIPDTKDRLVVEIVEEEIRKNVMKERGCK